MHARKISSALQTLQNIHNPELESIVIKFDFFGMIFKDVFKTVS